MSVVLQLRQAGVRVYSIRKKSAPRPRPLKTAKKIGSADLIAFNSQLASLLKTKLPLADSLLHLSNELKDHHFRAILEKVTIQVESGRNLSESMEQQREFFPPLYVSMVEAGEKSGNLAEVLFEASRYYQAIAEFRRKIVNILVYPAMLCVLGIGILIFLLKLMVPPYIHLYSGFQFDFPFYLRFLVGLERFLSFNAFWQFFAPACVVGLVAVALASRRNEMLRTRFDRLVLRIPFWGRLMREVILARSFATLKILLESGVPLYESLNIVKNLISNRPLRGAFETGADEVLNGQPFSQGLVKQPLFPLEVAWIVRNGETRGDLIGSLDQASTICSNKFDFSSQMILSLLEPILLAVVGAAVVLMAASLFYPLYSLATHLGNQ